MTDLTPAAIAEGERLLSAEIAAFNALIQAENAANMKTDDPLYIAYTDARDAYRSWCDGNIRRLLTAARDAARYREAVLALLSSEGIGEAMNDAWNAICEDTECHPLDITQEDRGILYFEPNHWAHQTASNLRRRHALAARKDGGT